MQISSQVQELFEAADERAKIASGAADAENAGAIVEALEALRLEFRAATIAMLGQ